MAVRSVAAAQRGVALAEAMSKPLPDRSPSARGSRGPRTTRSPRAAGTLTGPFLSHSSLTRAERLRLIEGLELVLEGVYTHLPLKRARYGFDPIQRLRILRTQVDLLD